MFSLGQLPLVLLTWHLIEQDSNCPVQPVQYKQPQKGKTHERGVLNCLQLSERSCWRWDFVRKKCLGFHLVARRSPVIATGSKVSTSMATRTCTSIQRPQNLWILWPGRSERHRGGEGRHPGLPYRLSLIRWVLGIANTWVGSLLQPGAGSQYSPVSTWWPAPGKRQLRVICTFSVFWGFVMGCLRERISLWGLPTAAVVWLTSPGITLCRALSTPIQWCSVAATETCTHSWVCS